MTLQEQYDALKRELNQTTQGTEDFMLLLYEIKRLENFINEDKNNRENNSTLSK